jgi:hypothetical protein
MSPESHETETQIGLTVDHHHLVADTMNASQNPSGLRASAPPLD